MESKGMQPKMVQTFLYSRLIGRTKLIPLRQPYGSFCSSIFISPIKDEIITKCSCQLVVVDKKVLAIVN